jgi:hypothetical protein
MDMNLEYQIGHLTLCESDRLMTLYIWPKLLLKQKDEIEIEVDGHMISCNSRKSSCYIDGTRYDYNTIIRQIREALPKIRAYWEYHGVRCIECHGQGFDYGMTEDKELCLSCGGSGRKPSKVIKRYQISNITSVSAQWQ